jgi:hypothetical protein
MRIFSSLCIGIMISFSSTSAFGTGVYFSSTETVNMEIDKSIVDYDELAGIKSDIDREFISVCMQLTKQKAPGQYTMKQAFLTCQSYFQSI